VIASSEGAPSRELLRGRILGLMAEGAPPGEAEVDALALEVLRFQARENPVYGTLLRNRGLDPEALPHWGSFPPVPTRAFRIRPPFVGDPEEAEAIFLTSGTTAGRASGTTRGRGEHRVREIALYRASLLPNAVAHLRDPGEEGALRVLALMPTPGSRPESSLAHMAGVLLDSWDDGGGAFLADPDWRIDPESVASALARAREDGTPVLLLATAFSLVHLLDSAPSGDLSLPPGSRVMETGGFKGRSREVERGALYEEAARRLGLPRERIVNEYGMTELLSQFYEPVLAEGGPADPAERRLVSPPWARTRVLDPVTLDPAPPGTPGLLCHLDLANLDSAALLLTEDLGVEVAGPASGGVSGFRVLGRNPGAPPRGCSLSIEGWMEAAR
jgi:hypothetical protein